MTKRLCGIDRDRWGAALEFKPEDFWLGIFWRTTPGWMAVAGRTATHRQWWICLVPMLPIHISIVTMDRDAHHNPSGKRPKRGCDEV